MTQMKAVLAYQIPTHCYTARSGSLQPESLRYTVVDDVHTWPLIDGATSPGFTWRRLADDDTNTLEWDFEENYITDKSFLLYRRGLTGSYFAGAWSDSNGDVGRYRITFSADALAGNRNGNFFLGYTSWADTPSQIKPIDTITAERTGGTQTWMESSFWKSIDLPYDPELTTYSVTPILPSEAAQTFTSLGGKKSVTVYGQPLYRITMTYTWSDPAATMRLRKGLEQTLKAGSSLLFAEPCDSTEVLSRPVHLIQLSETPVITQPQRGVWTVTINGETQP